MYAPQDLKKARESGPTTTNCQRNGFENGQRTEFTCSVLSLVLMILAKALKSHIKIVEMGAF